MAIFSRRVIQRMLNENAAFLSREQLKNLVSRLNKNNFQSLDAEWEVAVLNAFSKIGTVIHEPKLPDTERKLDLLFAPVLRQNLIPTPTEVVHYVGIIRILYNL